MKRILSVASLAVILMSCGNANDGNANTDTTNFNNDVNTGTVPGAIGDTGINMDPSTNTDTTSRPYSGASGDTGAGSNLNSSSSGNR